MKNSTRTEFNKYTKQLSVMHGVKDVSSMFTPVPSLHQKIQAKEQESTLFGQEINVIYVTEQSGKKVGLGMVGSIASRTDTGVKDRDALDNSEFDLSSYECKQINFDTAISYEKLDAWASQPNFTTLLRDSILKRAALDKIMIGLNGVRSAATTDREANPLLQDVAEGWLQRIRNESPERHVSEIIPASGAVSVGDGGDYKTVDALVFDAFSLIPDDLKEDGFEFVVVVSRHLISDRSTKLLSRAGDVPTELEAALLVASSKRLSGLRVVAAPFMPRKSMLITPMSNLSIYYQEGKDRRRIVENSKRDRIESYESSNMDYVVEDFRLAVLVDNIDRLDISDWHDDSAFR